MSSIAEHRQRAKSRKSQTIKNAQGVCVQTMPKKRWNESFIGVKFFQLRIFNKTLFRKKHRFAAVLWRHTFCLRAVNTDKTEKTAAVPC